MIMARLQQHLRTEKIMNPAQGAFQPFKSSVDQVAFLCQRIQDNFNADMSTLVVFVDFKAAYDLVSRDLVIKKLINMNTPSNIVYAVRDFLCQRFVSVRCHDRTSSYKQIRKGLPQGSVSSTTLFNCFVNDLCVLLNSIAGVELVMFADDLAIIVKGNDITTMETVMNEALHKLSQWVTENEMIVSLEKTKYQLFTMKNNLRKPNLFYDQVDVKETTSQRYLGIILDQRLTFRLHITELCEKASKRLKILKRLTGTTWGTSMDTLKLTYKTYILPILCFGEELLICASKSNCNKLDVIQNQALRIITGGIKSTPILAMEMFSGIQPLKFSRDIASLKMYERILRTPNSIWKNYKCVENRLKSKISFVHQVRALYDKYSLPFNEKIRRFCFRKKFSRIKKFTAIKKNIQKTIGKEVKLEQQNNSIGKSWQDINPSSIRSINRKIYVANFRKLTGHDLLYKHLARIGVKESPMCGLCNQSEQTSDHLLKCKNLSTFRQTIENLDEEKFFATIYWHVRSTQ